MFIGQDSDEKAEDIQTMRSWLKLADKIALLLKAVTKFWGNVFVNVQDIQQFSTIALLQIAWDKLGNSDDKNDNFLRIFLRKYSSEKVTGLAHMLAAGVFSLSMFGMANSEINHQRLRMIAKHMNNHPLTAVEFVVLLVFMGKKEDSELDSNRIFERYYQLIKSGWP